MAHFAGRRETDVKFPMGAASVDPTNTQHTPLTALICTEIAKNGWPEAAGAFCEELRKCDQTKQKIRGANCFPTPFWENSIRTPLTTMNNVLTLLQNGYAYARHKHRPRTRSLCGRKNSFARCAPSLADYTLPQLPDGLQEQQKMTFHF